MKHVLPALVAVVCTFTACKTTADRYDLYQPDKPQGPATARLRGMTLAGRYNHQSSIYTYQVSGVQAPAPAEENGPVAPPPPPPPPPAANTPENSAGAPAATPLPAMAPAPVTPQAPAPAVTPAPASEPAGIPGLSAPPATTPAPAGGASPAPSIPGLSQ